MNTRSSNSKTYKSIYSNDCSPVAKTAVSLFTNRGLWEAKFWIAHLGSRKIHRIVEYTQNTLLLYYYYDYEYRAFYLDSNTYITETIFTRIPQTVLHAKKIWPISITYMPKQPRSATAIRAIDVNGSFREKQTSASVSATPAKYLYTWMQDSLYWLYEGVYLLYIPT